MPTEPSPGKGDDPVTEVPDEELTFAVHDLGRERGPGTAPRDLGFIPSRPVVASPVAPVAPPPTLPAPDASPAPATDGFVIRDADGVAPAAPVVALVVGAPETPSAGPRDAFRISSTTATRAPSPAELWTTRNPAPEPVAKAPATSSRRGWSTRHSEVVDRSAHATMLRLREEAVNVSWKSAWIAVTSCDPRLLRRRSGESS
jgi:hypothetical protein